MSRPRSTGRHDTYAELVEAVLIDYYGSPASRTVPLIALTNRVTEAAVHQILREYQRRQGLPRHPPAQ